MRAPLLYALPPRGPTARNEGDPIRVVVGDDHEFVRHSLRQLLDAETGLEVVGEAGTVTATLAQVHHHRPHVVVLDLCMPGGLSLEAIRRLRAEAPDTEVVVTTMQDDPRLTRDALAAGAIGYVLKETADADLPTAIRRAAAGKRFVTPRLAVRLGARVVGTADELTPAEVDVLHLIAPGHSNAQIASELHISVRTVESHRVRIHQKLGLTTRAELARYALKRGLLAS